MKDIQVGDLVQIKKGIDWRNTTLPSTAIVVEVIIPNHSLKPRRYRIHTGENFFASDLELLYSSASWSP